ncbi:TPA: amino acid ABC transporter permease [Staphylococcus pseudintermedius]|nr:amino acid ABC transporter permease [Staphylococcus pseudintermedius]
MKNIQLVGKIRYLIFALVAIQAIIILMMTTFRLGEWYDEKWDEVQNSANQHQFYLNRITIEQKEDVMDVLKQFPELLILTSTVDEETNHELIGLTGKAEQFPEIQLYDHTIMSQQDIVKLLNSKNEKATIGDFNGSIHNIKEFNTPYFAKRHSIVDLQSYIHTTKSINGSYTVYGSEQQFKQLIKALSVVTHQSETALTTINGGVAKMDNTVTVVLSCLLIMTMLAMFILFIAVTVANLKNLGHLTLLGWSKWAVANKVLRQFVVFSILIIPVFAVILWYVSGWHSITLNVLSYFFLGGVINLTLTLFMTGIAVLTVFSMKPVDAIKGKVPHRTLYGMGALGYVLLSILLVFGSVRLDEPIKEVVQNFRIAKQWENVSNYYTLKDMQTGEDLSTIAGKSNALDRDIYHWYQSIVKDANVFIAHSEYFDKDLLEYYREQAIYENVPEKAFWYMTFSPNYLKNIHLNVAQQYIDNAESGTKVFLIPDSYTKQQKEKFEQWIKESESTERNENDIPTAYNQENRFKFITYHFQQKIFSWNNTPNDEVMVKDPIIYIITPENMNYLQSESLRSNDLNSYIKFKDRKTAENYTTKSYLEQYHLADNELKFVPIQVFIDGLQKDLAETIVWFGSFIVGALLLSILLLISLAYVYRLTHYERLYISKFLGFSFFKMYSLPMILILSIWAIDMLVVLFWPSKSGIVSITIYGAIQLLIFYLYMSRNDIKQLLLTIKEKS